MKKIIKYAMISKKSKTLQIKIRRNSYFTIKTKMKYSDKNHRSALNKQDTYMLLSNKHLERFNLKHKRLRFIVISILR